VKASSAEGGALERAKINFFVDAFMSKVNGQILPLLRAEESEKEALVEKILQAVEKEVEPLLKDAGPFFGGSSKVTLAEVSILLPKKEL